MQSHRTRWLSLFLCSSVLVACGDDSPAGGSSAGGNDSGGNDQGGNNTGAGQQGGNNTGAGEQGGEGPNGGAAQGGAAQGGGNEGGGGGVANPGSDGANCVDDSDCDNNLCLSEDLIGIPGGMCTEDCTDAGTCSSAGSTCVGITADFAGCLRDCDPTALGSCGAPNTLACLAVKDTPLGGSCFGFCDMNAECTVGGNECHDEPEGNCAPPEVCDNAMDDDFDGDADCADDECSALPACAAGTCLAPTPALALNNGSTVSGGNLLDSVCATNSGNEVVYSFTSPVTGGLFLAMLSDGDLTLHVRTDCDDAGTELGCADAGVGGDVESMQLPITAGQTVFIVVDAFSAGDEDTFQLSVEALTEVCDDLIDGDVDGSMDCADSPDCNGTAACTPGATAQNGTCTANTDCASVAGADPACLTTAVGINANMCSEWCNLAVNDCGAGKTCFDIGLDQGWCFTSCTIPANCPANFDCVDFGVASDLCVPAVPTAWTCDDAFFNDGFCDCGCAVFDPDCADDTVGSCQYCDDTGSCSANTCPGDIDPLDNATCN